MTRHRVTAGFNLALSLQQAEMNANLQTEAQAELPAGLQAQESQPTDSNNQENLEFLPESEVVGLFPVDIVSIVEEDGPLAAVFHDILNNTNGNWNWQQELSGDPHSEQRSTAEMSSQVHSDSGVDSNPQNNPGPSSSATASTSEVAETKTVTKG